MRLSDQSKDSSENAQSSLSSKLLDSTIAARKVFITGEINHKMATAAVQQLHALAHLGDEPIMVFISSPGGHVESGDMIFDAIRFIKPKIITIGSGWVASAGSLIYVAAEKHNRYSLPNTRFLLHQPSGGFQGRAMEAEIYAREIIWMKDRLNKIFAEATGQPVEKIAADTETDFWLSAEEAVDYGLVHKIVTREAEIVK
ncbi:ATP-dependent Clp protease proteolytic subunit [Pseudomonas sp. TTU2014-080ASC]|uniref:ATP-dependent Clp protease proteolytic subunit n=1 Tax=Pseudomonas sp. TTU2014-080ASC TaxID=1729724 RepID=UPI0007183A28|nr:ATP-dependent Clp protease proteolytic subunit [Pseudomonas sp. TTU2014-080ASC]KRW60035.1 ATP-dependent Clp protease proteolytic subunit [Pseudomonas sp. TTU2014-080ASC]